VKGARGGDGLLPGELAKGELGRGSVTCIQKDSMGTCTLSGNILEKFVEGPRKRGGESKSVPEGLEEGRKASLTRGQKRRGMVPI